MSVFKSKRNESAALPLPQAQTVHNHPQSYTGLAFVIGGFVLALFPALWWMLCFLFEELGSRNPEYSAATLAAIVICGAVLWWPVTWLSGNIAATNHAHKVEIMKLKLDHEHRQAQLQYQSAVTGAIGARALESDYAMARGCLAVLAKAYNINHPYTANESRPWVRDNAWRLISAAGVSGIKWGDCGGVRGWLEENGFVVGNQLNRVKYPHFEDARRRIDEIAAPPILINPPTLPYREVTSVIKQMAK
jgi:hypothetical protein